MVINDDETTSGSEGGGRDDKSETSQHLFGETQAKREKS